MNNDISGTFESSLKNQSEMQSCKLNESESKPNVALRRIGQELDKAETKCFTLKSELNYMMGVCRKAQTDTKGNKETFDISPISSFKNPVSKSPVEHNDCNNEITDIFNSSLKSAQFSSRKSVDNDDIIERFEIDGRQKGLLNVAITPRSQLDKGLAHSITMPFQDEITEENVDKEYKSYYFPSSTSFEKLTTQADEDYLRVTPFTAKRDVEDIEGIEDPRLNLNAPNAGKARRVVKSRSRAGRSEINSVCRMNTAMSKARKRKAKIRSSVSKSTVITKDTGFIGRKEAKRRRHKDHGVVHQQSNPSKQLKKSNDVVEIFHNTRLKNSNSGVFSKHSKVDEAKCERKPRLSETVERRNQETSVSTPRDRCPERVKNECQSYNKKNEPAHCLQTLNCQNSSEATPEVAQEQDKLEKYTNDLGSSQAQNETRQRALSKHDNSMSMPRYGMPTLASKLKRSSRSYFSRFNFRNIPFVVATSVTPSHNLGLNIQQVLSVMKTRQTITSDITPLLIHKVSRGIRPVSDLLNQINNHYEGSGLHSQLTGLFNSGDTLDQDKRGLERLINSQHVRKTQSGCVPRVSTDAEMTSEKENNNVSKQLRKEKDDSCDRRTKQQSSSAVSKGNVPNPQNQQGISRGNIDDHKIPVPDSQNSKEIRDVLINLHDQFEEMNTKYERLQSEVDKSNDKSLAKELSVLEKELNAKEEEINAVVGLYKEVMTLKRQMKMLHEKNSLVCIATESAKETCKDPFPLSIILGKSHSMNPAQILGRRKIYNATREPPASMQLAALLRQIQTFHKQLRLVS